MHRFGRVTNIEFDDNTEQVAFTIQVRHTWTYEVLNEHMQDPQ